jgi:hypothetical protein
LYLVFIDFILKSINFKSERKANIMSEEKKQSEKEVNPELEEKIRDQMTHMLEAENEEAQEIDFSETDVSGGIAWSVGGHYKTTASY